MYAKIIYVGVGDYTKDEKNYLKNNVYSNRKNGQKIVIDFNIFLENITHCKDAYSLYLQDVSEGESVKILFLVKRKHQAYDQLKAMKLIDKSADKMIKDEEKKLKKETKHVADFSETDIVFTPKEERKQTKVNYVFGRRTFNFRFTG